MNLSIPVDEKCHYSGHRDGVQGCVETQIVQGRKDQGQRKVVGGIAALGPKFHAFDIILQLQKYQGGAEKNIGVSFYGTKSLKYFNFGLFLHSCAPKQCHISIKEEGK